MKASKISLNITYESIKKSQRKQVLLHVFFCHYIGKKKILMHKYVIDSYLNTNKMT